jgi:hypothetical protein
MTLDRFNNFQETWENAYIKYFGGDKSNVIPITESVAPYKYYNREGNTNNMVSIDIGGGTTDVVIGTDGEVNSITSFRFAANSVFGVGYNENDRIKNGIVKQFKGEIKTSLEDKNRGMGTDELFLELFEKLTAEDSGEAASFLFSLKDNTEIKKKDTLLADSVDFNKILHNDRSQTIVFLFFYAAIIYHVAHIMKAKKMSMPRHITFSGNGSKIIWILPWNEDTLRELTKFIFVKIYGETEYNHDGLTIIHDRENPKKATCKGGLLLDEAEPYSKIHNKKIVLKSSDTFISGETYQDIDNDAFKDTVVTEAVTFINFVLKDVIQFLSKKGWEINNDSYEIARDVCFRDLKQYVTRGLEQKYRETQKTKQVEETFFFYPLYGMLNALSNAICNNNLHP